MKVCYFTSMKCIIFSNQIVFMLFCLFCFNDLYVVLVRNTLPPYAATINALFFLFFFSAEGIKAYSYQCRSADEMSRMWDTCKVSIGKRCQHLRKNEKEKRPN